MQCPYCAEEIRDEAIVCRFCGAHRLGDEWSPPGIATPSTGPGFALRSSGVLFVISALFELIPPDAPVPLFGAVRGGAVAVASHLVFAAVFFAIGVGLWRGASWTIRAVVVGAVLYSAQKILYLFDSGARAAEVAHDISAHPEVTQLIDLAMIDDLLRLIAGLTLLGFWGFVLYVLHKRDRLTGEPRPA